MFKTSITIGRWSAFLGLTKLLNLLGGSTKGDFLLYVPCLNEKYPDKMLIEDTEPKREAGK
jgi:hypothetical protein